MIDHTGVGVADVTKSKGFYRAALAPLGYELLMEWAQFAGFGVPPKSDFWIGEGSPNVPPIPK
jgi:catechol 2,3-dioxygenase-like lactoylglutathione lyase family enzyme